MLRGRRQLDSMPAYYKSMTSFLHRLWPESLHVNVLANKSRIAVGLPLSTARWSTNR